MKFTKDKVVILKLPSSVCCLLDLARHKECSRVVKSIRPSSAFTLNILSLNPGAIADILGKTKKACRYAPTMAMLFHNLNQRDAHAQTHEDSCHHLFAQLFGRLYRKPLPGRHECRSPEHGPHEP